MKLANKLDELAKELHQTDLGLSKHYVSTPSKIAAEERIKQLASLVREKGVRAQSDIHELGMLIYDDFAHIVELALEHDLPEDISSIESLEKHLGDLLSKFEQRVLSMMR